MRNRLPFDLLYGMMFGAALVLLITFAYKEEPEPSQLIEYQSPTSGFISSGEYMAAFQEFGDGIYWIRIQREGFEEKAEFEVHSLNEARELLEKFSESGR